MRFLHRIWLSGEKTQGGRALKKASFLPPSFLSPLHGSHVDVLVEKQRRAPFIPLLLGADVVGMNLLPDTFGETCKLQFIKEIEAFYV